MVNLKNYTKRFKATLDMVNSQIDRIQAQKEIEHLEQVIEYKGMKKISSMLNETY